MRPVNLPANFRTTWTGVLAKVTAVLTMVAAAPFDIGKTGGVDVGALLPPNIKATIMVWSAFATLILGVLNAIFQKSSNVTGTKATGITVDKADGSVREIVPPPAVPPIVNPSPATVNLTKQ